MSQMNSEAFKKYLAKKNNTNKDLNLLAFK